MFAKPALLPPREYVMRGGARRTFLGTLAGALASAVPLARAGAQAVFPAGGAIGLVPPPGYAPESGEARFAAADGSGVIALAEAALPPAVPPRDVLIGQLGAISDRRLAALGVRNVRRRSLVTPAFVGSLAIGTLGEGGGLETVWSLYFVGADAMGSVSWRVAGAVGAERVAEMERVLHTVVTRPPADLAARLDALPFAFDASVHDLTRVIFGSVLLASRFRDEQMVIAILPPPDPPLERADAARSALAHPLLLAVVRDPVWDSAETPHAVALAGHDGLLLRAGVTHTPTGRAMRLEMRVGFLGDGRLLVVLGCAPAPDRATFAADERRFARVADSLVLR